MDNTHHPSAPDWQVQQWFNTPTPPTLQSLRGKVIVLEAFQMLCPGCVSHGLPQAIRVHAGFSRDQVAVIGLHTVFEHRDVMTPAALQAFLHEYRVPFPVGVDQPAPRGPIPLTMRAYAMQGTPTLTLIDRQGRVRQQHFGQVSDLALGAQIGALLGEPRIETGAGNDVAGCADDGCPIGTAPASTGEAE
ncbi:redoxin domain-containing protein [Pseudoxanthomonas beigongshangi]